MENLARFVRDRNVNAARFTAIGACSEATLGYFDVERKDYVRIAVNEQVEVLSLVGNVALEQEDPKIHAHVVIGKRDGTAHGGAFIIGARAPDARGDPHPITEVSQTYLPAGSWLGAHRRRRLAGADAQRQPFAVNHV